MRPLSASFSSNDPFAEGFSEYVIGIRLRPEANPLLGKHGAVALEFGRQDWFRVSGGGAAGGRRDRVCRRVEAVGQQVALQRRAPDAQGRARKHDDETVRGFLRRRTGGRTLRRRLRTAVRRSRYPVRPIARRTQPRKRLETTSSLPSRLQLYREGRRAPMLNLGSIGALPEVRSYGLPR